MIKYEIVAASVAADTNGFGNDVTGATFNLTANNAGDGLAHKIIVTNNSGTNHSGKTVALVGIGPDGQAQTEAIAGPTGGGTSTSTKFYLSLASATPSATIGADTFDIGFTADSVSPSRVLTLSKIPEFNLGFGCTVVSGSPTYGVEGTYDGVTWFNHDTVTNETTSQSGVITSPIAAIRLAFTAAGSVTLTGYQATD